MILDADALSSQRYLIVGYFSIALKILSLNKKLLPAQRKKITGRMDDGKKVASFLIGQLSRSDGYSTEQLPGAEILYKAMDIISKIHERIGGRLVLLECDNKANLRNFYESNDFHYLQMQSNKEHLIQMIRLF